MAKIINGTRYDEAGREIDPMGNVVGGGAAPPPAAPAAPTGPPAPTLKSAVTDTLMAQMKQPTGVDTTAPEYRQQVDAYRLNQQREADRTRAAMAQRAAAGGTNFSGGFDTGVANILQHQGENEQSFEAQLMANELDKLRQRSDLALKLGTGLTGQREGYELQGELGRSDLALRQKALEQQNAQFYDNLGLNQAELNQRALLQLLGGY